MPTPRTFAGFSSPGAILRDQTLSRQQKRTALLNWRHALSRFKKIRDVDHERQEQMIDDIDKSLSHLAAGADRPPSV